MCQTPISLVRTKATGMVKRGAKGAVVPFFWEPCPHDRIKLFCPCTDTALHIDKMGKFVLRKFTDDEWVDVRCGACESDLKELADSFGRAHTKPHAVACGCGTDRARSLHRRQEFAPQLDDDYFCVL